MLLGQKSMSYISVIWLIVGVNEILASPTPITDMHQGGPSLGLDLS